MGANVGIGGPQVGWFDQQIARRATAYLALTKIRIIELLLVTTVPTMFVAAKTVPSLGLVVATLSGGTLAAAGANVSNMIYDRDIDAGMGRTKSRPLVTGAVSVREAVVFAIVLEAAAFAIFATTVNVLSGVLALGAAVFYLCVYTMWLKRRYPSNIVIGGAAGAMPPVIAWTAVTGRISIAAVLCFGLVFMWTPPHFWALAVRYREDYAAVSVPMLPVVADLDKVTKQILGYTVIVLAVSIAIVPVAHLGGFYIVAAAGAGLWFGTRALLLRQNRDPSTAMRLFSASIIYLTVVFVAMGLDALIRHP
ncbi:MAG TPA: heme o synthase [Acidimicrobiales bacterium]|nr:heme o synthase [Acidimicrobiales bacterium]